MNQSPPFSSTEIEHAVAATTPATSASATSAAVLSAADIQTWIVAKLAEALQVAENEINVQVPFVDYGLESIVIFTLTGDLADWLDRDLPATLLWEHPTVETLSRHLAQRFGSKS